MYRIETEKRKEEEDARLERKKKQAEKAKRWEMLRWIVSYIEDNKKRWEKRREEELSRRRKEAVQEDAATRKKETEKERNLKPEEEKERRLEISKVKTRNWKAWREGGEEDEGAEDINPRPDQAGLLGQDNLPLLRGGAYHRAR